ncbi:imelysin family protein [Marinobacterium sp. MBR-109]|jgi:predicted lipoprotein|uniref:imelysin family protein n=1 Tax=Marinobacterium sp. MBR-109 TaxID=3156462 RepID=UPI003390DB4E
MKKLVCIAALLLPLTAQAETPLQRWHADLSGGYATLLDRSAEIAREMEEYCAAPDAARQTEVRRQWAHAFMAWQAVRFVEFGPIEQDSMGWQMQFWPDKKNLIARKSQMLLRSATPVTVETLANEGVAVKGFPALEYLLFEHEAKHGPGSACPVLAVIGTQLEANARTLAQSWQQFESHFESRDAYTSDMVKSAIHATEIMRDKRLGEPMGLSGSNRRVHFLADAWRSEQSLATIQASLEGLERYFMPGLETMLKHSSPELLQETRDRLDAALEKSKALPAGMKALLGDDAGYAQLQSLFISMDALVIHLNDRVAVELGIVKGFNSSDGD